MKAGKGPAPAGCAGGVLIGGDTGVVTVGNGRVLVRLSFRVGCGTGLVRLVVASKQTPCWVLKEQTCVAVWPGWCSGWSSML